MDYNLAYSAVQIQYITFIQLLPSSFFTFQFFSCASVALLIIVEIYLYCPFPRSYTYLFFCCFNLSQLSACHYHLHHKKLKGAQSRLNGLKSLAKLFNFVVCNPCRSSPSLTILVPLWFIIVSLMFFYLCKVLFSGFLQFNGLILLMLKK